MRPPLAVLAATAVLAACTHPARPVAPKAPLADAPYELADDLDFAERQDDLHALPPGPARTELRAALAAVLGDRFDVALAAGRIDRAATIVGDLANLWRGEAQALPELAAVAGWPDRLDRARAAFARGGADRDAALVLVLRAGAEPAGAARDRAELEEIVAYADDLAQARMGALGIGTGVAAVLAPVIERGLAPELVARYTAAIVARANLADAAVTGSAAPPNIGSPALRQALGASRDLAVALAAAHAADRISHALVDLRGFGRDRNLEKIARAVAAADAAANHWAALAQAVRALDGGDEDAKTHAALTICTDGLVRFPDDATLLACAGTTGADLPRVAQPIAFLEAARERAPGDAELADRLLGLYRERLARLVYGARPLAAQRRLDELRAVYRELGRQFPAQAWSTTWAEALATYGRGLVSQGDLAGARRDLEQSVALEPTIEALEMLGTIALKTGDYRTARRHFERAIALPGDRPAQQYARAKLLRLAGEAAAGAGDRMAAAEHYTSALELWADLGDKLDLPPNLAGERLVESGKLFAALGKPDDGAELLSTASDVDPHGADTHIQSVAFLLLQGRYDQARDNFYQALASDRIGDYFKVYMALWILAEGRRAGVPDDEQARRYLDGRNGTLWYDDVARLATERATPRELLARAHSRARKTELTYYTAVLQPPSPDEKRRLLEDVIASDLVLFFEYDMAKHQLRR